MQIVWVFYVCDIIVFWYLILVYILCALQIKTLYVGNDFVGDVPLTKKILAALTTGKQLSMVVDATGFTVSAGLRKEEKSLLNCICISFSAVIFKLILSQWWFIIYLAGRWICFSSFIRWKNCLCCFLCCDSL